MQVEDRVDSLEAMIAHAEVIKHKVSKEAVGWHIDHSLKVIIKTCMAVKKSDPNDYKWHFNYARFHVFTLKSFRRGVVRAPNSVRPQGEVIVEALHNQMTTARALLKEISNLPVNSNFNHPYFGLINLPQVHKFLNIHTHHHLKIMRDIID